LDGGNNLVNFTGNSIQQQVYDVIIEEEDIYTRFSRFVCELEIQKEAFCKPLHLYLTLDELSSCFHAVNFKVFNKDDLQMIFKDLAASKTGYLPVDELFKKLTCWKDTQSQSKAP
jgi:hypothetical protein